MRLPYLLAGCLSMTAAACLAATLADAVALHQAGRLDEALSAYSEVVRASSDPAEIAGALNNACVLLNDRGDFERALPECRRAVAARRDLPDELALAQSLNNLALAQQGAGERAAADSALEEALAINRRLGEAEEATINLANLAAFRIETARYGEALDALAEAEALIERHASAAWAEEQRRITQINRAVVLERLGAWRESLDLLAELVPAEQDPAQRATLLVDLGVDYRNLGDPRQAQRLFLEAMPLFESVRDRAALANAWLNYGLADELGLRRPDEARTAYTRALALARAGDLDSEIQALIRLSRLETAGGRAESAADLARRALDRARSSGDGESTWAALDAQARAVRAAGDADRALDIFTAAITELEAVRSAAGSDRLRAGFLIDKRELFGSAIDLSGLRAVASGARADALAALALVQRSKARDLLDGVGQSGAPLGPAELDSLASGRRRLLEFAIGEEHLWRFELGRGILEVRDIGSASAILASVRAAHDRLAAGSPLEDDGSLGRTLLGSLRPLGDEVVIAPDGILRYLPFDLLRLPDGARVIEHAAVLLVPSLSFLRSPPPLDADVPLRLLAIAPSSPARPDPRSRAGLLASRFDLAPLPASGREAAALGRLLRPALVRTDTDADEQGLRDGVAGGVRVLHIAAHTVMDERLGDEGVAIFLAPGRGGDGLLEPSEIRSLPLRGALTLLAGCSTALGSEREGRAQNSLVGSFLVAGASGVVASLWDVGDEASAALMTQFGAELAQGREPSQALRRAKLRLAATPGWESPALWGAYVLFGDPPPVAADRRARVMAAIGGLVLLLAALAYRSRRRGTAARMRSSISPESPIRTPESPKADTRNR